MTDALEEQVADHYTQGGLLPAILAGLEKAGGDTDRPSVEDLAPVDEFHTAGRLATVRALAHMPLEPDMHVLDAGSGIGGTSRVLAAEHRCRVTGLDLTPEYVDVARALTDRMGLSDRCGFETGSVTDMPFDDQAFDAAISFHVAMNIADRAAFYGELARVLRPGAFLCLFDVMKGPTDGMRYPVPWAETAATSFLISATETGDLLNEAGFAVHNLDNLRDFAVEFFRKVFERAAEAGGPPPLGLHLLTGSNAPEKFSNYAAALTDHQVEPVVLIAKRVP